MKIIEWDPTKEMIQETESCAACIGYFDGFHIGHRKLVEKTIERAKELHIPSAVITFHPDPWIVLKGLKQVSHITTLEQRYEIAEGLGIDIWVSITFSKELAAYSPDAFVKNVIYPLQVKALVCGFDYTFGAYGKGTAEDLKKYPNFTTDVIEQISNQNVKISSTRIEEFIQKGDMETVEELLAKPYTMRATVVHGKKIGRQLGFPTLNLDVQGIYVIPANGVYAGYLIYQKKSYLAMINVGNNPTFHEDASITVEAHILDFDQMIYGETVDLIFKKKVREEKCFASESEFIQQLKQDVTTIKKILK
ncbi:MAG: bifunctional riboflavin kinase/FAD synthetase [Erysipelotrichaceae bacterium]|nr:bifunctional riboflavin kinase/FAD synthetase [Erysipelotrichaceae bacterium]